MLNYFMALTSIATETLLNVLFCDLHDFRVTGGNGHAQLLGNNQI